MYFVSIEIYRDEKYCKILTPLKSIEENSSNTILGCHFDAKSFSFQKQFTSLNGQKFSYGLRKLKSFSAFHLLENHNLKLQLRQRHLATTTLCFVDHDQ